MCCALLGSLLMAGCTYTRKITDGQTAFERRQYPLAIELLQKDFRKARSRVEKGKLAFLIGESWRMMHENDEAARWYRTAWDNLYGVEALKQYAYALKRAGRYEEAMQAFKELGIEIGSPYEYRKEISACQIALGWLENQDKSIRIEAAPFNSSAADYAPALFGESRIVFTSDRAAATGDEPYHWTGRDYTDLFVADPATGIVEPFDAAINTPKNEGTATFTADGSEMGFVRCANQGKFEDGYCRLYYSRRSGNGWTPPLPLPFQREGINYGQPAPSADGSVLYFSCNDPEGWGGYDLWRVERHGNEWGEPRLLSRTINTPGNEQFPTLHGDTLYFASDGHIGMGGLDIFRTWPMPDGGWVPVRNVLPPLNSSADDFALVVDDRSQPEEGWQHGWLTSNRDGNDDIYHFVRTTPETPALVETPTLPDSAYKLWLDVYVLQKIFSDPNDPSSQYLGRKPLPDATLVVAHDGQTDTLGTGQDGLVSLQLEWDTDYTFTASAEGFLTNQATFSTRGIGRDPAQPEQHFELEIVLDRIYLNREIVLEDIYYDFDRWEIRDDAKPTLDRLAQQLKLNPDIRIMLSSHTDCRGSDRYNLELSQKRAQAAVDYLISKGISPDRLVARGMGETQPRVQCLCSRCTEEEHQLNRRTTFTIVDDGEF